MLLDTVALSTCNCIIWITVFVFLITIGLPLKMAESWQRFNYIALLSSFRAPLIVFASPRLNMRRSSAGKWNGHTSSVSTFLSSDTRVPSANRFPSKWRQIRFRAQCLVLPADSSSNCYKTAFWVRPTNIRNMQQRALDHIPVSSNALFCCARPDRQCLLYPWICCSDIVRL